MKLLEPYTDGGRFDVVVIGSGFGGSVSACRFAEADKSVLVLERGRPYPPGSFPRSPKEMRAAFWDPSRHLYGMFNVWHFQDIEAVVSSGLGGGSLIYANVLLRKDEHWFTQDIPGGTGQEQWGVTREDLDPYYDCAERTLRAQTLPFGVNGYQLRKTAGLRDAAARLGKDWSLVPLAVRFHNDHRPPVRGEQLIDEPYGNIFELPRRTCRLCGECDIGCNDGSKNTLDHTYLSKAYAAGARLSPLSEVKQLKREGDHFVVEYVVHEPPVDPDAKRLPKPKPKQCTVEANKVVLAAGTFGSTFLLLTNAKRLGLPDGPALGSRFSGNGDLLGFVMKADRRLDPSTGPVITSAMRLPDKSDTQKPSDIGAYIEDAGYPGFADWLVEFSRLGAVVKRGLLFGAKRLWEGLRGRKGSDLSHDVALMLGSARLSSSSVPLLGMGRDVPDGRLFMTEKDWLDCDWHDDTSKAYLDNLRTGMQGIAKKLDGRYEENPLTSLFKRLITVHPLGGCPMDTSAVPGVVDSYGRVHGVDGLFVADGSVMPGPIGPNPSLTIAAFAERLCAQELNP